MPRRPSPPLAPRKTPKQARSSRLVEAILQAAIRVLERDGAAAFTTIRVAERAGVSVGSLYQYFPNKESILFRLQEEEWAATSRLLDGIFNDTRLDAAERLRAAMRAFFRTECDEAPLRRALGDAAPLYRDSPQAHEKRERGLPALAALIDAAAPGLTPRKRAFAAELYITAMTAIGKQVSEADRTPAEVDAWATATADMFLAYLRESKRR
ncbi:TetR family transcriptional regulator [Nannocystis pusilla]|uniref:TetR family transcriptional regulator n=1 Tax=Nannocystis pusilla TaxID=889268 RepID=A0ABS7TNZ6_9BACT|nr:TetR family transcriptional regulator [Nannocystis pusilla]MBZ5709915.1 TetR family transcriptional regulator [Nannocystis pusilla]